MLSIIVEHFVQYSELVYRREAKVFSNTAPHLCLNLRGLTVDSKSSGLRRI